MGTGISLDFAGTLPTNARARLAAPSLPDLLWSHREWENPEEMTARCRIPGIEGAIPGMGFANYLSVKEPLIKWMENFPRAKALGFFGHLWHD